MRTLSARRRGGAVARNWQEAYGSDPVTRETASHDIPNPIREYFDSLREGRGIWKWLHYFDIYHRHFERFVGKDVNVVEVGIYSGGSLDMWKSYFGRECKVYGIDIKAECKLYEGDRTKVFIGDQSSRVFWADFRRQVPDVDILIDDGGHLPEQQIVTLEETVPYLRSGGVYLCEDITGIDNQFSAYLHGLAAALNSFDLRDAEASRVAPSHLQRSISSIHLYPFVAVIEKNLWPVAELVAPKHGSEWQPFFSAQPHKHLP